jgi:protein-tyrosine phosphatase
MSLILPNLYLGDRADSEQRSSHYNVVVNCTPHLPFLQGEVHIRLPVHDDGTEGQNIKLYHLLRDNKIFHHLHHLLKNNKRILIHCNEGRQRSPTTLACFLLYLYSHGQKNKLTINHAADVIQFIQRKRHIAFRNSPNFLKTIKLYYEQTKPHPHGHGTKPF